MKRVALVALLFVSCSSGSDLIDSELVDCAESGNEISVMLSGLQVQTAGSPMLSQVETPVVIDVEVSNNSHDDVIVKKIILRPRSETQGRMRLSNAYGTFDQTIEEGKDHVFTLRTTGRWAAHPNAMPNDPAQEPSGAVEVEARVELANGQTYRCWFAIPVS